MRTSTIAPRLKLLGLLLICASIMMGLLLSAVGVQTVNLKAPFSKKVATRVNERWEAAGFLTSSGTDAKQIDQFDNTTSIANQSTQVANSRSTGNELSLDGSSYPMEPASSDKWMQFEPIADSAVQKLTEENDEALTISLWLIIAPMCCVGILLWMTPQPQSTNRFAKKSSRR